MSDVLTGRRGRLALSAVSILAAIFIAAPILVLVPLAFSGSNNLLLPPDSFSIRWFLNLVEQPRWRNSAWLSIVTALLSAGSLALARADGVLVRRLALEDAQHLLDWQQGWLVFRDTPLSEVVAEFNRYNTRKLVLADERAGALRIGGSFRWDNEAGFVRLLEAGFPIRAESVDGQILLHAR